MAYASNLLQTGGANLYFLPAGGQFHPRRHYEQHPSAKDHPATQHNKYPSSSSLTFWRRLVIVYHILHRLSLRVGRLRWCQEWHVGVIFPMQTVLLLITLFIGRRDLSITIGHRRHLTTIHVLPSQPTNTCHLNKIQTQESIEHHLHRILVDKRWFRRSFRFEIQDQSDNGLHYSWSAWFELKRNHVRCDDRGLYRMIHPTLLWAPNAVETYFSGTRWGTISTSSTMTK